MNQENIVPGRDDTAVTGDALLRKAVVLSICSLSEKGLHLRLAAGTFPKPVYIDARNPAWFASEIREWILKLKEERDAGFVSQTRANVMDARRRGGLSAQARKREAASA
jgi:prophage regulatory protein